MSQFRPISLCNVSYKIVSKLLCQRMKKILPCLISETQLAFFAGRLITYNILSAYEMFQGLRTNLGDRVRRMAIKIDMSKAYDRVEWYFIKALLQKMGFYPRWIGWIMECIESVSYHVLINAHPRGNIRPERGLRQGYPLSQFLFILCTKMLIGLLKEVDELGRITEKRVARASPAVSHLLFIDDSLFFSKADTQEFIDHESPKNIRGSIGPMHQSEKIFNYVREKSTGGDKKRDQSEFMRKAAWVPT